MKIEQQAKERHQQRYESGGYRKQAAETASPIANKENQVPMREDAAAAKKKKKSYKKKISHQQSSPLLH